jgi:hypothetical protein
MAEMGMSTEAPSAVPLSKDVLAPATPKPMEIPDITLGNTFRISFTVNRDPSCLPVVSAANCNRNGSKIMSGITAAGSPNVHPAKNTISKPHNTVKTRLETLSEAIRRSIAPMK